MNNHDQVAMQGDATVVKGTFRNKAISSLLKTVSYAVTGHLHFRQERIGEVVTTDDGQEYIVFRQVIVDQKRGQKKKPAALLRIRFNFAHGSPKQNKRLSLIPIPFIAGLPGFRSKTWALQKLNGGFQGIYEWDSVQDAETYKKSFAIKLMTKRAVAGSVTFQIIPK